MSTSLAREPLQNDETATSRGRMLTTKLSAPRLRPNLVARPDLLELITNAHAPVTLVCAPAGYGKSTLVTHWLIQSGLSPAWVSLDRYDNDPWNFFALVTAAVRTIDPEAAAATQSLLDNAANPTAHGLVLSLLRDLEPTTRSFVLVLDDYHVINDPAIHDAVATLLSNIPRALRVFLITRIEAPLPLARLRGRQDVFELGQEDLRFTDDEALDLMHRTNGLDVSPGEVGTLNNRAEGWAAGLQLVGHVLRGQSADRIRAFTTEFSGNVRSIENYLWEEVIEQQSADVQMFLMRTSILDRFCGPLCDAISDRDDGVAMIRQLEQDRLFVVSLDDTGRWYRFHHLFADVLRERLEHQASDEDLTHLHQRAAAWLEERGHIEDAARHAVAGRDWDRASCLLEKVVTELYRTDRNRATVEWLHSLPDHVLRQNPLLAFYLGFAMSNLAYLPDDLMPLQIAEEGWTAEENQPNLGLVRLAYSLRSILDQDPEQVVEYANQAIVMLGQEQLRELILAFTLKGIGHYLDGDCPNAEAAFAMSRAKSELVPQYWVQFMEMAFSGGLLVQQGKLPEAAALLQRIGTMTQHTPSMQFQQSLFRMGDIYAEWNRLDDAEQMLRQADMICEQMHTPTWQGWINVGLARVLWSRGDVEGAFHHLDRAIELGNQLTWIKIVRDAKALQARLWLELGQLPLARRWAESCDLDPYLPPTYQRQVEHLTFVRILIAEKRAELALRLLDAIGASASQMGRDGDRVEIEVLRALAFKAEGDQPSALIAMDRALAFGEPGGYIRTFTIEGEAFAPLLRHAAVRSNRREFAKRILEVIDGGFRRISPIQGDNPDALTEREIEVLRLVALGLSNRTIGERLFIAEKTVKKHLSNILGKLGATNRTQAVDQARKLGLV